MAYSQLTVKASRSVNLATRRINIWEGSVRSGKTVASILAWLRYVRTGPPGDLLMVGKTERTLKRNVINPVLSMIGNRASLREGAGELMICGRLVYLVGANDARSEEKIRGMTLAGAYVDELTLMPEPMWRMLGTRLSVPGARIFATTNPDSKNHWAKQVIDCADIHLTVDGTTIQPATPPGRVRQDLARFTFVLADNPHLSPDYIQSLYAEYTGLWRRRFIDGEWVMAEGAVFPDWDVDTHTVDPRLVPNHKLVALGVDYGTTHTFAAELLAAGAGRLWFVDEWRHSSKETRVTLAPVQYSRQLREWLGDRDPGAVYVDPAAADFRQQLWVDGMPGVTLANNEVAAGIRTLSSGLASGKLFISKACEGLIECIPGYAWDPAASMRGEDKPVKAGDDEVDAARYAAHSSRWIWGSTVDLSATARSYEG